MKYIDKIRKMSVDELALSLKTLTDGMVEIAIKQILEKYGYKNIDFQSETTVEDFKFCLENEVV